MDEHRVDDGKLREPGLRELRVVLEPQMEFDAIVETLKEALTFRVPLGGGCGPCLSGLDRIAIDSTIFEQIQQRRAFG
jgi:hypothetical protein